MAERKTVKKEQAPVAAPVSHNVQGVAVAAMIVGIIGIVFCWLPVWGFIIAAVALALGIVGLAKRVPNRGMALAGTIMGGVGVLLNILFIIGFIVLAMLSDHNGPYSSQDYFSQPQSDYWYSN